MQHLGRRLSGLQKAASSSSSSRSFSTLVVTAGDAQAGLAPATQHVISAAKVLGNDISFLATSKEAAEKAAAYGGKTYLAEGARTADALAPVIADLQKAHGFKHILAASGDVGRDCLPRVGALLDVQPVSDILEILGDKKFKRPMYAGNAIATVEVTDDVVLATVRPTAFPPAAAEGGGGAIEDVSVPSCKSEFVSESTKTDDKPQLGSANVVVAGGRALQSSENFDNVLQPLCDKMTAAMGASRAAVDAGYVPNDMQVGQTGKVVAPDCYVAVGISGAIQHLAGMKDSKTIVAINKDPDAPIFSIADYGLVADLFEAVPEMTKKI
ncbi:unnamed protein product [Amoebophrya sp. A120]|nr:unnamed protein product [Amoebophrya sp. A120]|eukprot:GSA120T00011889001.1